MTIHTVSAPAQGSADDPPPVRPAQDTSRSTRRASLGAGTAILLIAALSVGAFAVPSELAGQGDAAGTARVIVGSEGAFRLGIASMLLIPALDVVVAWGVYRVLAPVDERLSMLAAWLRVVSAGIYMVAISQLLGVLHLLGSTDDPAGLATAPSSTQVLASVNAFDDVWAGSLLLFGVHLVVVGWLAHRSGYVPRVLAVLLVVAGLGYLCDSLGPVLFPGYSIAVKDFTFIGELLLSFWLLARGGRTGPRSTGARERA
jgi:hypothetical protein